jgi:hypothetical protein
VVHRAPFFERWMTLSVIGASFGLPGAVQVRATRAGPGRAVTGGGGPGSLEVKVAVTDRAALMPTVQIVPAVDRQSPDQPPNVDVLVATAARVTVEPTSKLAEHVTPQEMRDGVDVTVPGQHRLWRR